VALIAPSGDKFFLSPAAGERTKVRGKLQLRRRVLLPPLTLTLSPSEGEREGQDR